MGQNTMKQEEKTGLTKERILQAAMQEFGTNGYAASTLNTICSDHAISKGLLYHNFAGKDGLYLACVARCFSDVTEHLEANGIPDDLENYMHMRLQYFSGHPHHARIFFEAMLQPPAALSAQIRDLRKDFDLLNRKIYQAALSKVTLREGVTEADAIAYYEIMQVMFNGYFSSPAYAKKDFQVLVKDHEQWLSKMLNLMLYGIGEKRIQK